MTDDKDIHFKLGSIMSKLDAQGITLGEIKEKVESHEDLKNKVIGICAALSIGVGLFIDGIKDAIAGIVKNG